MTKVEEFGRLPDGHPVLRSTIAGGGLKARVLTWGSVVQELRLDGHDAPLTLGFERFDDYLAHSRYFGATAGRCANRIRDGAFTLDGRAHQLDRNFLGKHHLHGGAAGIGKRLWTLDDARADSVTLSIALADGEMGYPGAMRIELVYALLDGGALDIRLTARADRPTLCNLAHHSYFNLDGSADILGHELRVAAEHHLPVDGELIPTGEVRAVAGGPFDFRQSRHLCEVCASHPIDNNFCLAGARRPLTEVAELFAPASGVRMRVQTTEPGLQVYDGGGLAVPVPGLGGRMMGAHAGVALEPQVWPDAIHHPDWPQPVLRPGETYAQHTQYVFGREARP